MSRGKTQTMNNSSQKKNSKAISKYRVEKASCLNLGTMVILREIVLN